MTTETVGGLAKGISLSSGNLIGLEALLKLTHQIGPTFENPPLGFIDLLRKARHSIKTVAQAVGEQIRQDPK